MVKSSVERRSPERGRHTLQLLRRLSALSLAIALILLVAPRLLAYFGLIGPSVEDRIAEAERAVRAAESYGAKPDATALAAARQELATARRHASEGHPRAARAAAARAGERAREAQAIALVREGDAERKAHAVVEELDGQVNELENMYEALSPSQTRDGRSALFKKMRSARKAAATVFLAHDEKRFEDALALEAEARRALAETRGALEAAGAPRSTPAPSADPKR